MDDVGGVTFGADVGDFGGVATGVTEERIGVGVESQGEETGGTEGLPTAFFADSEGRGAAAVVKNEGLVVIFEVFGDGREKNIGKVVVLFEIFFFF